MVLPRLAKSLRKKYLSYRKNELPVQKIDLATPKSFLRLYLLGYSCVPYIAVKKNLKTNTVSNPQKNHSNDDFAVSTRK
jgi:hypothetical protein